MNEITPSTIDKIASLTFAGKVQGAFRGQGIPPAAFTIVPEGHKVELLPPAPFVTLPDHIAAAPSLQSATSFADYVKRFTNEKRTLAIFFDSDSQTFKACLDYHSAAGPARNEHAATYALQHSQAWEVWASRDGKWLTQEQILEIFETRGCEIEAPTAADLLKFAGDLSASEVTEFASRYDRASGKKVLVSKAENVRASDGIPTPDSLTLSIPCYRGGTPVQVAALLHWKGHPQQFVKFTLVETDRIKEHEQKAEIALIAAATGTQVLAGRP